MDQTTTVSLFDTLTKLGLYPFPQLALFILLAIPTEAFCLLKKGSKRITASNTTLSTAAVLITTYWSYAISSRSYTQGEPIQIKHGQFESATFRVDLDRFENAIRQLVKALYFFDFAKKLKCAIKVIWGVPLFPDMSKSAYVEVIEKWESIFPPISQGENPRVFGYDFPDISDKSFEGSG